MPAFPEEFHQTTERVGKCPKVEMECAGKRPIGTATSSPRPSREYNLHKASNDSHEPKR